VQCAASRPPHLVDADLVEGVLHDLVVVDHVILVLGVEVDLQAKHCCKSPLSHAAQPQQHQLCLLYLLHRHCVGVQGIQQLASNSTVGSLQARNNTGVNGITNQAEQ
jgi:hypothetical protein